jgi:hypothetical protein
MFLAQLYIGKLLVNIFVYILVISFSLLIRINCFPSVFFEVLHVHFFESQNVEKVFENVELI